MSRDYLIPTYTFPAQDKPQASTASRSTLDAAKQRDIQIMCCGDGETVPIIFGGPRRVGVKISALVFVGADIILQCVVCEGPVHALRNIQFGDDPPPAGTQINVYLGTADQPVDPILKAAHAAQSPPINFQDANPGIAYFSVRANVTSWTSMPNITVEAEGFTMWDDRDPTQLPDNPTTWKFNSNPARCTAELFRRYTPIKVNSPQLIVAMNANDELVGGEPRRTMSLVLDRPQELSRWIDVFRSYANGWCAPQGDTVLIIPDRPAESVFDFTDAPGLSNIVEGSFKWWLTDAMDQATSVQIEVTDTSTTPWSKSYPAATAAGVLNGTLERRKKVVAMEGITSYSQGYREAVEQLNHSLLETFNGTWDAFDVAISLHIGDVVTVTFGNVCHNMKMRLLAVVNKEAGRYTLTGKRYDPEVYSNAVVSGPAVIEPILPDPSKPPAPTGLHLEEELFPLQDRTLKSRLRASWTAVTGFPYQTSYHVEVWSGSKLMHSGDTEQTSYATPVVEEGVHYIVRVATRTSVYASPYNHGDITAIGKGMPPPDVEKLTIHQVANWVLFSWPRVVDIDAIKRYQIRRWPAAGSWETGVIVDEPDMLAYRSNSEPAGTWNYGIVAIDQGERPSQHPLVVQFRVAPDNSAYFVDDNQYRMAHLSKMFSWITRDGGTHYSSNHGDTWGDLFHDPMANYPLPVDAYHASGESSLTTEWWDIGVAVDGQFTVFADVQEDDRVTHTYVETSADMVDFAAHDGGSARTQARFVRIRFVTDGAMTINGLPRLVITANPRVEPFAGMSRTDAPIIVTLDGKYYAVKDCSINPQGVEALTGIAANYQLTDVGPNTFEVRIFNAANQQVAAPFTGTFYGISY